MERRLLDLGYRFRPPRPGAFWHWALTPVRRWVVRRRFRVHEVELRGQEHLKRQDQAGAPTPALMFAMNHPAHGDPFVVFEAMHRLRLQCCYLAAWQAFTGGLGLKGWAFQRLGAFSIDREGTDMRAFRTAVDVLAQGRRPLVIFPEGDVYHINDRITPLREGAAMIAITAARRRAKSSHSSGGGPLHIVPCAIKYHYLQDPTPNLLEVMEQLERRVYWRPDPQRPLVERIYRYAQAVLSLKELEYLGTVGHGPLPERIANLTEHVLSGMEQRRLGSVATSTVPERVKRVRQHILRELGLESAGASAEAASSAATEPNRGAKDGIERDLDDLHLVTQLFSYPGDYLHERPTIERLTETLDKFEEDALGADLAGARAPRRAILSFGPPIDVTARLGESRGQSRDLAAELTTGIERGIQEQLDLINASPGSA